ncbi:uncharacterized protein METZ01_LOCUS228969 [marine metagenome]|uniref:Uncharacterized protein n=1 Tax=marine metagenome TaxID=408172 RepID=A0A382GMU9_9ZZZZ|tara:strand:- start:141 stop:368 length:228 start_codon:yes stop_codon:yes gene_type:complete
MRTVITEALRLKYEGAIAEAKANIEIYLTNSAGIGEHPEILSAIDTQVEKIAEAEDKLIVLAQYFKEDNQKTLVE